jgi:transposase-like protein
MNCPKCGSKNYRKSGFLKSGKQRYTCKECGKGFSSKEPIVDVKKPCIYCGGNTVKSGKTKWGKQIYLCKDCGRKFNETRSEILDIHCPICGGELKYKGWSNNGHSRRYLCRECGKSFSGEDPTKLKVKVVEKPCPYCGSENIKKGGHLKSGAKRYVCNDCGKGYNENTVLTVRKYRPKECPKCHGTHINCSGYETKTHKQRYKCVDCGYKFVENPTQPTFKQWDIECPYCHNIGAKKAGVSSNRKQYFICLKCNHKFMENQHHQHTTPELRANVIRDLELGMTKIDISVKYGVSEKTIRTITRGKELAWRRIQREQTILENKKKKLKIQKTKLEFRKRNVEQLKNKIVYNYSCYGVSLEENLCKEFDSLFNLYLEDKIKKYTLEEQFKVLLEKGYPIMEQKQKEHEIKLKRQRKFYMIKEILEGNTEESVASKYNIDIKHLQDILEKYYEMEDITERQKTDIIKFGIGAAVPVEYIAPYIPCSIKKCQKILSKYTIRKRQKYERTETDKHQDWYELDKFIMK